MPFIFILLIVMLIPLFIAMLYRASLDDAARPALLQEWARANHLLVLRRRRGFVPWRVRAGIRYSRQDSFACLEVLDEATHRVRRVWLLLRSHLASDMTLDDIEVLGWDDGS